MKTCKDRLHYDICLGAFGCQLPKICDSFKDKSRFIELPFCSDSYCTFGRELYRVFGVTANGENDFYVNIYKVDQADKVFTDIRYDIVTFISDEEATRMWTGKKLEELK